MVLLPQTLLTVGGAGSDNAIRSPKESKARGGKETKTHLGEEINPPPKPVSPSPSGLIYSDFLRLRPLPSLFPAIARCCTDWLAQSFRQNGEGAGFPWENMPWDAIGAKNMWPLSSTLISQNKTQGFLPSGVSDQQEKGKSANPRLGLNTFWQGAQAWAGESSLDSGGYSKQGADSCRTA